MLGGFRFFANRTELSLTEDKLVINMAEISGGIWVLDNVDR
jgi:hypothetical protein